MRAPVAKACGSKNNLYHTIHTISTLHPFSETFFFSLQYKFWNRAGENELRTISTSFNLYRKNQNHILCTFFLQKNRVEQIKMLDVTALYTFWHLSSYVISRYWVVFSVHDDSIPFLELWAEPTEVASKPPQFMFPLAVCQHISPSLGKSMKTDSFSDVL